MAAEAVVDDVGMVEIRRNPRRGRMAVVAVVAAREVRQIFAGRDSAVMAGEAGAEYLDVINRVGRCPDYAVVAVLADVGRIGVVGVLAGRIGTVMAADAGAGDTGMVEVRRDPRRGCMAVVAVVAARDVRRIFATR